MREEDERGHHLRLPATQRSRLPTINRRPGPSSVRSAPGAPRLFGAGHALYEYTVVEGAGEQAAELCAQNYAATRERAGGRPGGARPAKCRFSRVEGPWPWVMARFPGRPLGTGQLLGDPPGRCNAAGATPRRTHPAAHNYPGPHPARELPPRPHPTTPVAAAGSPPAAGMAARRGRAAQPLSGLLRSSAALALMLIAALMSQPTSPRAPVISANLRSKPRVGVDGDGGRARRCRRR